MLSAAAVEAAMTVAVPRESSWKYDDTGADLGTAWRDTLFDDSGWAAGPGPLGYIEYYINTTVSFGGDPANKNVTTYFRIPFDVSVNPATVQSLWLHANFDDGYVAYINGVEVTRQSMPSGAVTYSTWALSHEGGAYEAVDLSASIPLLKNGTNILAVEAHQVNGSSSDLVWDAELRYSADPAIPTRGPYLQVGTPTSMTVRWRTDVATDSRVRYGSAPGSLVNSVTDATATTEHELTISGLTPATTYYYAYGTTSYDLAGDDANHHFKTSPPPGTQTPIRIWIIGDSGSANGNATNVRNAYKNYPGSANTDVWLMLGDNAYNAGTDAEYQAGVFDMYPDLLKKFVVWPTRGNHDQLYTGANNDYYDIFTLPTAGEAGGLASGDEAYYSFDYGNIHFICLDSQGSNPVIGGAMMNWLTADLAATTQDWTIAFWHHPPYTKGSHDSDNTFDSGGRMYQMRNNALRVLDDAGCDLVLGGHSHAYERSFLLEGHYGFSSSLQDTNKIDAGDGKVGSGGPYVKPTLGAGPHEGVVYAVAGSSSKIGGGSLNHPVMITSLNKLGSLVLDVDADRLDAHFIDDLGAVLDEFTIIKGITTGVATGEAMPTRAFFGFDPHSRNPVAEGSPIAFLIPAAGRASVSIHDVSGRLVRELVDEQLDAGEHIVTWDGRNSNGRGVAPGTYFSVLRFDGEMRSRKITFVR